MGINTDEIKKALDYFENDKYVDAKEILQKEIRRSKNDFLKNKLELKSDLEPAEEVDTDGESDADEKETDDNQE